MVLDNYKDYAPVFVRLGVGVVFFLFGIDQLIRPEAWFAWLPSWVTWVGPEKFFLMNGIFDLVVGILLLVGLLTRIAAFFAVLHLIGVILVLGYNDVAIRDFGLLLGALSVFLYGADKLCLDKKIWR